MRYLTVTFKGLIASASTDVATTTLYCHPEGGAHVPTLTIPVRFVNPSATNWVPSLIGHDSTGAQLAIWNLADIAFQLGDGTAQARGAFGIEEGLNLITLHQQHNKTGAFIGDAVARTVVLSAGAGGSVIAVSGGKFGPSDEGSVRVRVSIKGTEIHDDTKRAGTMRWVTSVPEAPPHDAFTPQYRDKDGTVRKIALRFANDPLDIRLAVSNIAAMPSPDGLTHVQHYYDFLTPAYAYHEDPNQSDQVFLEDRTLDRDEYDCVPPGTVG